MSKQYCDPEKESALEKEIGKPYRYLDCYNLYWQDFLGEATNCSYRPYAGLKSGNVQYKNSTKVAFPCGEENPLSFNKIHCFPLDKRTCLLRDAKVWWEDFPPLGVINGTGETIEEVTETLEDCPPECVTISYHTEVQLDPIPQRTLDVFKNEGIDTR